MKSYIVEDYYSKTEAKPLKTIEECGFETPEGHEFTGWSKTISGSILVGNQTFEDDCNLYGNWSVKTYSIKTHITNGTIKKCLSSASFLEQISISCIGNSSSSKSYSFSYMNIYAGTDSTGTLIKQFRNTQDEYRYTMCDSYYQNIYIDIKYSESEKYYDVTLEPNGGTINSGNITEYIAGAGAVLPTDVTKENYEFSGWFDNSGLTGSTITTIGTNETGDKSFWAKWNLKTWSVTFYDNQACNVIYKINTFGCTPTVKTTIDGTVVDTSITNIGDNTIVISTKPGLNAKLEILNLPSDYLIYIEGEKKDSTTYSYITKDGVITSIQIFVISKNHTFDYINDEIHENKFIYSPGTLVGGLKYNLHWQSAYDGDSKKEETDYGLIHIGHLGLQSSHKMHMAIAYQVNNGPFQTVKSSFKGGTDSVTGYFDDNDKFHDCTSATDKDWIGATNLEKASTSFLLKDSIIDVTSYSPSDIIKIGIILKDHNDDCAGISLGKKVKTTETYGTKCTVSIIA